MSTSEKWADYLIAKKQLNQLGTHIDKALCYPDRGDSLGTPIIWTRTEILTRMQSGYTFETAFKDRRTGKFTRGAKVVRCVVNGRAYIKTEPDGIEEDNLDELPDLTAADVAA